MIKIANQTLGFVQIHVHTHTRSLSPFNGKHEPASLWVTCNATHRALNYHVVVAAVSSALTYFSKQKLSPSAHSTQLPLRYPGKSTRRRQTELVVVGCDLFFFFGVEIHLRFWISLTLVRSKKR